MDISMVIGLILAAIFIVPFVWISLHNSKESQAEDEENQK